MLNYNLNYKLNYKLNKKFFGFLFYQEHVLVLVLTSGLTTCSYYLIIFIIKMIIKIFINII
jgi:hypothetical protein